MTEISPVDLDLEQYRSLRTEIMRSMEDGNQIMNFGLAAYGLVLNAGVTNLKSMIGFAIFAVVLPVFSSLTLSLWFAAQERIARASFFITGIEQRLAAKAGAGAPPTWDIWLRGAPSSGRASSHFWNTEYTGVAIFVFLMLAPVFFSYSLGGTDVAQSTKLFWIVLAVAYSLLWVGQIWRRVERWRNRLSTLYQDPATAVPAALQPANILTASPGSR